MNTLRKKWKFTSEKQKDQCAEIMFGFYIEVEQIIRDCEIKTMNMTGQILILWIDVKNDLDISEYQRGKLEKNIHRWSTYRKTLSAAVLPDYH